MQKHGARCTRQEDLENKKEEDMREIAEAREPGADTGVLGDDCRSTGVLGDDCRKEEDMTDD